MGGKNCSKNITQYPPLQISFNFFVHPVQIMKHFEVTMTVSVKITIYWNVMPCSLVKNLPMSRNKLLPHTQDYAFLK